MPFRDYQHRMLLGNMADAFAYYQAVTDSEGRPRDFFLRYANPAFEQMAVLGKGEIRRKSITDLFPLLEEPDWLEIYKQVAQTEESIRFDYYSKPTGRWYEVTAYSDKPGYLATLFQDITASKVLKQELGNNIQERKRAEEKLKESEEKYRSLVNQSIEMLYLHDLEGNLLEVNKMAIERTGYSKEELLQMNVFDLHPDDYDREDIRQQWKSWPFGQPVTIEHQHSCKNGTLIPVEIITGKVSFGGRDYMLALVRDINERKTVEDLMKEQTDELSAIYENAPVIMMLVDGERKITKINGYGLSFTGKPLKEVLHRRGGEALNCLHALETSEGCGFSPPCGHCTIRNTVLETLDRGYNQNQKEVKLPLKLNGKKQEAKTAR